MGVGVTRKEGNAGWGKRPVKHRPGGGGGGEEVGAGRKGNEGARDQSERGG